MRLSTFDFNYMIWGQFGDNPATIRGPIGRGGPINTSGSRRNDFVQYCKVGRQTEQFWIKMYPRPLLIFTVVRIDQIYNIIIVNDVKPSSKKITERLTKNTKRG